MRSYDPWDACVTMAKSWGNLKWVTAAFMRDRWAQGICVPVQFSPRTWRGQGAGKSARASWLLSWRGPKAGERKGARALTFSERLKVHADIERQNRAKLDAWKRKQKEEGSAD